MAREAKYHFDVEIDKLTNSVQNTISGDSFSTDVSELAKADLRIVSKKNGWLFNWGVEFKRPDKTVFKLTIRENPHVIQGLISVSDNQDHYYMHLIESAPFNKGRRKLYEGVPGNLVAYICKLSWDRGFQGFVLFTSKTKLIEHYEKTLGATHVGANRMVLYPDAALILINKYFGSN